MSVLDRLRPAKQFTPIQAPIPPEILAGAGREVWPMHDRKCRRNLQHRHKIRPEQLFLQLEHCQCGRPEQRLEEYRAARGQS